MTDTRAAFERDNAILRAEAAEAQVADFDRIERKWIAENTRLRQALVDVRQKLQGDPRNIEPAAMAERISAALEGEP